MSKKLLISAVSAVVLTACGTDDPGSSSSVDSSSSSTSSSAPSVAGELYVSEAVYKSADGDFLAGNDWIELHNAGSSSVNLSQYALADSGSDIISLPSITVGPGEYTVIAAADKDDENPPSPSVPFKLGKEDAVNLYFQGNLIDSLNWVEGDSDEGTSYGLIDGVAQTLLPTPGEANVVAEEDPADFPRGNPSGNTPLIISEVVPKSDRPTFYDGEDWLELQNVGSSPVNLSEFTLADDNSTLQPLPDQVVQPGEYVVVVAGADVAPEDGTPFVTFGLGREDSISLFRGDQEVDYYAWERDQSKNGRSYGRLNDQLEILYPTPGYDNVAYVLFTEEEVYTVRVDIASADWQAILANPQAEQYYPADFELNGARISNVGFRVKGQASLSFVENSIRYGFKVDMNEYVDQKFMGMKKLVFNQSFSDPSFMRDKLAYDLMREAGVPAPEITYVDMWVGNDHLGLYQMIEMIDTEFLEKNFPEDDEDLGDLYKGELGQRLTWNGDSYANYSSGLRLKTNRSDTQGTPEEGAPLVAFLDGINNSSDPLSYIDVDTTIKYLAASVLIGNMDSPIGATANNFYLYERRSHGVFTYLPWDYNLSMGMWGDGQAMTIGGFGGGFGGDFGGGFGGDFGGGFGGDFGGAPAQPQEHLCRVVNHVIDNPVHDTNDLRPMFDPILQDPQLRQRYHSEIERLLDTVYNPEYIQSEIDRIVQLIDPYVQADPTKFFTYDEWKQALDQGLPDDSDISAGRGANTYGPAPGIMEFVRERSSIVRQQLSGQLPSSNNGGTACPLELQQ